MTFGPVGRILCTIVAGLPLLFFLRYFLFGGWVGILIYGGILYPWAIRDIWRSIPEPAPTPGDGRQRRR